MNFSEGFKKYFFNTSWLMVERLVGLTVTLIVGIYVARYLGPQRFGLLNYAISFVGLFAVLSTFGLDQITVREFVTKPSKAESIFFTVFCLKLIGALIVLGLIFAALVFTNNDLYIKFLIFIIAAGLLFQSFNVIDFYFQSQVTARYVVISKLIRLLISSAIKVGLVLLNADLLWFAIVILLDSIFLALSLFVSSINKIKTFFQPIKSILI